METPSRCLDLINLHRFECWRLHYGDGKSLRNTISQNTRVELMHMLNDVDLNTKAQILHVLLQWHLARITMISPGERERDWNLLINLLVFILQETDTAAPSSDTSSGQSLTGLVGDLSKYVELIIQS